MEEYLKQKGIIAITTNDVIFKIGIKADVHMNANKDKYIFNHITYNATTNRVIGCDDIRADRLIYILSCIQEYKNQEYKKATLIRYHG